MSDQELVLLYQDQIAGRLIRRLPRGELELTYDEEYLGASGAVPISTGMTLDAPKHNRVVLENWLAGLLPDDDNVLKKWRADFDVKISSPFGLLGTAIGEDCAGAFKFVQPERVEDLTKKDGSVVWLSEQDMENLLKDLKNDSTDWLGTNPPGRFSLAGAQSKTALLREGGRWGRPSGKVATSHIVKPAIKNLDSHDLNEHLCLAAARVSGINAAITHIETFGSQSALFVQRYDRAEIEGQQVRVHQEDMCQAFGRHPTLKYQNKGGPSPKEIANKMRVVLPARRINGSLEGFADALIWNWILCGTDAHSKNYSLLIADDDVQLAPLYDIASILPYNHQKKEVKLAMKFGGGYGVDIRPSVWGGLANDLGLPESWVRDRAKELVDGAPDAFSTCAAEPKVRELKSKLPAKLIDAISERVASCRKSLGA